VQARSTRCPSTARDSDGGLAEGRRMAQPARPDSREPGPALSDPSTRIVRRQVRRLLRLRRRLVSSIARPAAGRLSPHPGSTGPLPQDLAAPQVTVAETPENPWRVPGAFLGGRARERVVVSPSHPRALALPVSHRDPPPWPCPPRVHSRQRSPRSEQRSYPLHL
jgi:hypothetical protein